jgi:hypothetical protein
MKVKYLGTVDELTIPKQTSTSCASPPSVFDQAGEASSSLRRLPSLSISARPMLAITQCRTLESSVQFIIAMADETESWLRVKPLGHGLTREKSALVAPTALLPVQYGSHEAGSLTVCLPKYLASVASANASSFFLHVNVCGLHISP